MKITTLLSISTMAAFLSLSGDAGFVPNCFIAALIAGFAMAGASGKALKYSALVFFLVFLTSSAYCFYRVWQADTFTLINYHTLKFIAFNVLVCCAGYGVGLLLLKRSPKWLDGVTRFLLPIALFLASAMLQDIKYGAMAWAIGVFAALSIAGDLATDSGYLRIPIVLWGVFLVFLYSISAPDFRWSPICMGISTALIIPLAQKARNSQSRGRYGLAALLLAFLLPLAGSNLAYHQRLQQGVGPLLTNSRFVYHRDTLGLDAWPRKMLVLDFWHTRCGACIEKFPAFHRLAQQYAQDTANIAFFTVNIPLRQDSVNTAALRLHKEATRLGLADFAFQQMTCVDTNFLNQLSINTVPMLLIIDGNQTIRYQGQMNMDVTLMNNTPDLIADIYRMHLKR
jgi:thiol-disulfide isomerase/thioredoxin